MAGLLLPRSPTWNPDEVPCLPANLFSFSRHHVLYEVKHIGPTACWLFFFFLCWWPWWAFYSFIFLKVLHCTFFRSLFFTSDFQEAALENDYFGKLCKFPVNDMILLTLWFIVLLLEIVIFSFLIKLALVVPSTWFVEDTGLEHLAAITAHCDIALEYFSKLCAVAQICW